MGSFTTYFIRHGQTDWNAENRFQGQVDTQLNATGRAQAWDNGLALGRLIANPGLFDFIASPMRRTRETMERLRAAMGLDPSVYQMDARLMEVHFGDWQGYIAAELEAANPGCFSPREADKWGFTPPGEGAESYADLAARVRPWLESLAHDTVCVTHGGVIRTIFLLTGTLAANDAAMLAIPQDRILRLQDGRLEWL